MIPTSTQKSSITQHTETTTTNSNTSLQKDPTTHSESDAMKSFVNSYSKQSYTKILSQVIPKIQTKRAHAYATLHKALRHSRSFGHQHEQNPANKNDPFFDFTSTSTDGPAIDNYPAVCAHVTEELKLCSEGIMTLRSIIKERLDSNQQDNDAKTILNWIDNLQKSEEEKLYATVAMHTISRSATAKIQGMNEENSREKLSKYAKQLQSIDDQINEVLEEMKEFYMDELLDTND